MSRAPLKVILQLQKQVSTVAVAGTVFLFSAAAPAEELGAAAAARTGVESLQNLNAEILASRSATFTLEKWCRQHHLSGDAEPKIVARLLRGEPKIATREQRERLQVGSGEELKYRHVELRCGTRVLSEADNWYVPGRLTAEMNRQLNETDTPFGKAIASMQPYRRTREVSIYWFPLLPGWSEAATTSKEKTDGMPEVLFEHHALVYTQDGLPISEVRERYQRALADAVPTASR